MFFLLYKHADDALFDDFLKTSDHSLKISKIFQISKGQTNIYEHFLIISECFPKITKDCQRLPKIAEDNWRRSEDVLIMHQQIFV